MAQSSTLTITELTETRSPKRSLQLRGSGLFFRPAGWSGKNNIQTTWYPGNGDEGTQQILGPREMPSNWSGMWRYTQLIHLPCLYAQIGDASEGIAVIRPNVLMDLMESILRGGLLLRVVWEQSGPRPEMNMKIVREGRAESWKFDLDRSQDIAWNVNWEWKSRGKKLQTAVQTRDESIETQLAKFRARAQRIIDELIIDKRNQFTAKQAPTTFNLGKLEAFAALPTTLANQTRARANQYIAQVQQLVNVINVSKNQPYALTNGALQITQDTITSTNRFVDQLSRIPPELTSTKSSARDIIRSCKSFNTGVENSRNFATASAEITQQMRAVVSQLNLKGADSQRVATRQSDIIAVHVARQGDTPITLSLKYYSTPDNAVAILKANKLSWYLTQFRPGLPVIIPNLDALNATT